MRRISLLVSCLILVGAAQACNIPVFRYALERWRPDACQVIVLSDDPHSNQSLSGDMNAKLDALKSNANLEIIHVRNGSDEARSFTTHDDKAKTDPHIIVRCKVPGGKQVNVLSGSLDDLEKLNLTQSPARKELQRRLLKGDSIVWVVVKSPDEPKNIAVEKQLKNRFDVLAKKLELPEGIGLPGSELFSEIPLLLQFSTLKIEANDPKERFLVKLLTGLAKEEFDAGDPLVVPVFGRGRALDVIPADQLSDQLIDDLTVFLCGACSCQVKERNPGFDLLIHTDWDAELFGADGEVPLDKPLGQRQSKTTSPLTIPPGR